MSSQPVQLSQGDERVRKTETGKRREGGGGGGGRGKEGREVEVGGGGGGESWLDWSGCCLLLGCLTSKQHASASQGPICSDNFTCCHTEIQVADQTFYLIQSQYTDTGPTSPSADPVTPGAW